MNDKIIDDVNKVNVDKYRHSSSWSSFFGVLFVLLVIFTFIGYMFIAALNNHLLDNYLFVKQKEITTTSSTTSTTLPNTAFTTLSNDKQLLFINHVDKLVKNTKYCSIKDYSDDNELYIVCDNYKIIFNQKEKQVDKIEIAVTVIENNSIVLESAGDPIYVREDKLLSEENIKKLDDLVANSIDDILNKDKQKEISEKEEHILNFIKKQELIENTTDL